MSLTYSIIFKYGNYRLKYNMNMRAWNYIYNNNILYYSVGGVKTPFRSFYPAF